MVLYKTTKIKEIYKFIHYHAQFTIGGHITRIVCMIGLEPMYSSTKMEILRLYIHEQETPAGAVRRRSINELRGKYNAAYSIGYMWMLWNMLHLFVYCLCYVIYEWHILCHIVYWWCVARFAMMMWCTFSC